MENADCGATAIDPRRYYVAHNLGLTHLNIEVFDKATVDCFLPELVVHLLSYDRVSINDGDLIHNDALVEHLSVPANFDVFRELLTTGAVTIRTLSPSKYPEELRELAETRPIAARVFESQKAKRKFTQKWNPTPTEKKFFDELDNAVAHLGICEPASTYPAGQNQFAGELHAVLAEHRERRLAIREEFRAITESVAEKFAGFCVDNDAWHRFLRDHKDPVKSTDAQEFGRAAAYRCATVFGGQIDEALRLLCQAVFAKTYCQNQNLDARYGGRLIEVPTAEEGGDILGEPWTIVRLERTDRSFKIPLVPELGAAIRATREGAFRVFQGSLRGSLAGNHPGHSASDAWFAVAGQFSEEVRARIPAPWWEHAFWSVVPGAICRMGAQHLGFDAAISGMAGAAGGAIGAGVSLLGRDLARARRGGLALESLAADVAGALGVRCSEVSAAAAQ